MKLLLLNICMLKIVVSLSSADEHNDILLCQRSDVEELTSKFLGTGYFLELKREYQASHFPVVPGVECFSIDVKSDDTFYFILGKQDGHSVDDILTCEVMWTPQNSRIFKPSYDEHSSVVDVETKGLLTPDEWRTFWLSWSNGVFQVGRAEDTEPFIQYEFSGTNEVNVVSVKTDSTAGASVLIRNPECPNKKNGAFYGCSKIKTLSPKTKLLVAKEKNILNRMIFEYKVFESFKGNTSKTLKDILNDNVNKYSTRASAIHKEITETMEYKIKIAVNNDITYSDLDLSLYHDIKKLYLKFLNALGDETN